jgi:hypothetical protein
MKKLKSYLVAAAVIVALGALTYGGCRLWDSDRGVVEAVEKQGYTNAQIVSKKRFWVGWRGCSESDTVGYDMVASNARGERVNLIVCGGKFLKGYTVRSR